MRIRVLGLFAAMTLLGAAVAHAQEEPTYYLALGDSLAQGVQPSSTGADVETDQGYVDDLYALLRLRMPELKLAKLGCPAETTTTMIAGGNPLCGYSGSQLAAAENFLATHKVAVVTLDIGANDIDGCVVVSADPTKDTIDQNCVIRGLTTVLLNMPNIVAALRTTAPASTPIVGMNYYDPFLAAVKLLPGPTGQALAAESLLVLTTGVAPGLPGLNTILENAYQGAKIPVADVASAYQITNTTEIPFIHLPLNVFLTLTWTWMGAAPPVGPNIHPNAAGYAVIAGAFAEKIGGPALFTEVR